MTAADGGAGPRNVGAALSGILAGAAGFAVLLLLGWLLYQRLWPDSAVALGVVLALFGAAGAFGGWLVGMIVFSAVRTAAERGSSSSR